MVHNEEQQGAQQLPRGGEAIDEKHAACALVYHTAVISRTSGMSGCPGFSV